MVILMVNGAEFSDDIELEHNRYYKFGDVLTYFFT